ncbi:MAG: NADH-quinone oxidoreductase subunit N [Candidatus Schekmanbacteria bacterium]|nr:NADH-quinone oxidoreductase subunit N [Candidatus Schekmanbacteria bacterium]
MLELQQYIPQIDLLYPEFVLTVWALFLLVAGIFVSKEKEGSVMSGLALIGLVVVSLFCVAGMGNKGITFSGSYAVDGFSTFFKFVFLISGILTILISGKYNRMEKIFRGEYYVLLYFSIIGMFVIASANDIMVIYIGIELMALSIYALVGFMKHDVRSNEAALKYFVLGSFSSGILLYGTSLLYGETSTTNLIDIQNTLILHGYSKMAMLGIILIIVGLAFKIAAVPFHLWCPDAYDGAPTAITAFMSVAPKAAGFAAFLRFFVVAVMPAKNEWYILLWLLSAFTMILGNVLAVSQDNVKRLLAYSSIAHAGYGLMGVVSAGRLIEITDGKLVFTEGGRMSIYAVLFYMLAYMFMNIGAFTMVIFMRNNSLRGDRIEDFAGLARVKPMYGAIMTIFLLSLMGIPPLCGFVGKFYIFAAAIKSELYGLCVIGILTSAVSAFYYFKIIKTMYVDAPPADFEVMESGSMKIALYASAFMTLLIGIFPGPFINFARNSFLIFM